MDFSKIIGALRVAAVTLLFFLVLAEVSIRVFGPTYADACGLFVPDSANIFAHKPGYSQTISSSEYSIFVSTDEYGHRNPPGKMSENGSVRVLVLGDSFAFGLGSQEPQSFPRRAESMLRETGLDAVVYNGGTIGYGTINEYNELVRLAPLFKPTHVLVAFFANDVSDNSAFDDISVYDGCIVWKDEQYKEIKNFLRMNSAAYNYFSRVIRSFNPKPHVQLDATKTLEYFQKIDSYSRSIGAQPSFMLIPVAAGYTELEGADFGGLSMIPLAGGLKASDYYQADGHFKPETNDLVAVRIVSAITGGPNG